MPDHSRRLTLNPLLTTLFLLVALAVFVKLQFETIEPLPATSSAQLFSAERAFERLAFLTREQVPHPVDSPANRVVEQRLVSVLREMGYQEEIQDTLVCRDSQRGIGRCARVRNIIVHIPGRVPGKGILLAAHYDSVPAGPGGSDAGAAVGSLLEIARLLTLEEQPRNSIVLLFNEGEEFGLLGAQAFMEQHPLASTLKVALNIEARGSSGKSILFETGEDSGWLVDVYARTTPAPMSSSLFYEVYKALPNDTDMTIFSRFGLQGLNFAHAERLPHYHTPLDNLANLDRGSLQHHGDNVWGVLKGIKDRDLEKISKGNLVFTDVLGLFVIQWGETTSVSLSVVCAVIILLFVGLGYRRQRHNGLNGKSLVKGVVAILAIMALSALAAYLILWLVRTLSGHFQPWYINGLPMQLALWFGVFIAGLAGGRWVVSKAGARELAVVLAGLWTILSVISSVWLPGISFLFLLPALASVIGLLVITGLDATLTAQKTQHRWILGSYMLGALVTAVCFFPVAYALEIMLTFKMSIVIGLVLGLIICAMLPLLAIESTAVAGFHKMVSLMVIPLVIGIGWVCWQPAFSQWMPQRHNLHYVEFHQGKGLILAGHQHNQLSAGLMAALPETPRLQSGFPWHRRPYLGVEVGAVGLPSPQVNILERQGNRVTVSVSSRESGLQDVRLLFPVESELLSIEMDNQVMSYQGERSVRNGYYEYHCRGVSCAELTLTLQFASTKHHKLVVSSSYAGLPAIHEELSTLRGNNAVPSQGGDQSVIIRELTL